MHNFFRSRRRKIGCVTLLTALIFMGGWIRSFGVADVVEFHGKIIGLSKSRIALISARRGLYWQEIEDEMYPLSPVDWITVDADGFDAQRDGYCDLKWEFSCLGFYSEEGSCGPPPPAGRNGHIHTWIVSYWLVVIPLTLVSAYLLLSRPSWRKKPDPSSQLETTA